MLLEPVITGIKPIYEHILLMCINTARVSFVILQIMCTESIRKAKLQTLF